jgi:hypothetical protein
MTTYRKTLYTLNVDDYAPDICALTHPLLKRYASKIGAEFFVITERKSPTLPPVIEKLQIYDIARQRGDDWIIFFDSDALVHPDMPDVTEICPFDTIMHNATDYASCRFVYDDYFRRDGRHIGSGNWFTVASRWCLDLWHPLTDLTFEEAVARIKPTFAEGRADIKPDHLIDDFILSRNIARFGLKAITFRRVVAELGQLDSAYLWHQYLMTTEQKLLGMEAVLNAWTGGAFNASKIAKAAIGD